MEGHGQDTSGFREALICGKHVLSVCVTGNLAAKPRDELGNQIRFTGTGSTLKDQILAVAQNAEKTFVLCRVAFALFIIFVGDHISGAFRRA